MDLLSSYEGYPNPSLTSDQLSIPFDPHFNYNFDFGSQPYNIDQFTDAFGGHTSYGIDDMGSTHGGPVLPTSGNVMPVDRVLAGHPTMHFTTGGGNQIPSESTQGTDQTQWFERYLWSASQTP
jgi:hypothetical protein